jgi:hypothetical protein
MTDHASRQLLHHADHFSCYYFDEIIYGCMEVNFTILHLTLIFFCNITGDVIDKNATASTISFPAPQISTSVPWSFLNTIG